MILYQTNYLSIEYDDSVPYLYITWKGYTSSEEFRAGLDRIFQTMLDKKISKTLTDIREHKVIGIEDQEYASKRSIEFDKNNWKVARALIIPKDVFARFAIKNVNNATIQEGQERKMFSEVDDAKEWLKSI